MGGFPGCYPRADPFAVSSFFDAESGGTSATRVCPGATLRIRKASTPEPEHRQIYRQLKVPERVMVPKHTWSEP